MTRADQDSLEDFDLACDFASYREGCQRFWNLWHNIGPKINLPLEVQKEIQEALDYIAPIIEGGTQ